VTSSVQPASSLFVSLEKALQLQHWHANHSHTMANAHIAHSHQEQTGGSTDPRRNATQLNLKALQHTDKTDPSIKTRSTPTLLLPQRTSQTGLQQREQGSPSTITREAIDHP
jgi:hypothetical protein